MHCKAFISSLSAFINFLSFGPLDWKSSSSRTHVVEAIKNRKPSSYNKNYTLSNGILIAVYLLKTKCTWLLCTYQNKCKLSLKSLRDCIHKYKHRTGLKWKRGLIQTSCTLYMYVMEPCYKVWYNVSDMRNFISKML